MDLSNRHNLPHPSQDPNTRRFGIRVSLPSRDPLRSLLGEHWHTEHWCATREERDAAQHSMHRRHAYSRGSDQPSLWLVAIDPPNQG